jgi:uncharacterized membrane protein
MTWLHRYQIRYYLRNSIWILPTLGMLAALGAAPILNRIEVAMGWESSMEPETARAVLGTLASSMFTFIVFVSSALLVVVQLASAQLTPRIIAIVFRDPGMKSSLTVFVFSFTFSLAALVRINNTVPLLTAKLAAYGCMASLVVFLYLIDHVGKALRPSGALRTVAGLGCKVIESVYPRKLSQAGNVSPGPAAVMAGEPTLTVTSLRQGAVLAFDVDGLVSVARQADCVIELAPQVGEFLAVGDPLFRIYEGGSGIDVLGLRQSIAVGQERTMEQDPALTFRIMVDIANKGLSPAINDPTTAVLAIDQIHHLLRNVGGRDLEDERVRDGAGRVRLVYRTPAWEDFVRLAVTEIRHFGGESIQIARRLRAMLEDLIHTLPDERKALLRQELELLHRSAARFFPEPEDQALAEISDSQGVGSHCERGTTERQA